MTLKSFEEALHHNRLNEAYEALLAILHSLDNRFGLPETLDAPDAFQNDYFAQVEYFANRVAHGVERLFTHPDFVLNDEQTLQLLLCQRWLASIFSATPYLNADHILQTYNLNPESASFELANDFNTLAKFVVLYFPDSEIQLDFETLWTLHPALCASLCFALQSPRFLGTKSAFEKRAFILQWFPEKLSQFEHLGGLPIGISHDVYMHCSYDTAENKHDIKKALNSVIRRHLYAEGLADRPHLSMGQINNKPVLFVVLEHFHSGHSIYRTHSTSLLACKNHFYLVGFGHSAVDEAGRAVFDEFYEFDSVIILERIKQIQTLAEKYQPAVLYLPSIGMDLTTVFLSNLRLAPLQVIALGHPATTHSDCIDAVIVEDDYVGDEACFSERLFRLPKDALPYVPSVYAPEKVRYQLRSHPETVHIGIASTIMKLNPYFLEALQEILKRSGVKIQFHFALGQCQGVVYPAVKRFIRHYLGDQATIYPHLPYGEYLEVLGQCDLMLNPFPFGNTNGIIDMVTLGLVGVCKTGREVHEHIDEGLFKRLGLPHWLICSTADDYVNCALRLIENHEERQQLRLDLIANHGLKKLFTGQPHYLGEVLKEALSLTN